MIEKVVLLLDGDITAKQALEDVVADSYVIAADGAIRHSDTLGIATDLWVGDFDSTPENTLARFADVKKLQFDPEKAQSDGELALAHAVSLKPQRIVVCGATGGPRFDHALMNLALVHRFAVENPQTEIWCDNGHEVIHPLLNQVPLFLNYPEGTEFSVFAFSALQDLSISGAKWPLLSENVPFGSTLTLSNVISGQCILHLGDGHAIAIVHRET